MTSPTKTDYFDSFISHFRDCYGRAPDLTLMADYQAFNLWVRACRATLRESLDLTNAAVDGLVTEATHA